MERWQAPLAWREAGPVAPADIPALAAMVHHRAWLAHLALILQEGGRLPEAGETPCRFAPWLAGEGRHRYGGQPTFQAMFQAIERLHDQAHALAERLLERAPGKDETTAEEALQALRALHDQLTEQVFQLLQSGQPRQSK